eukprot:TRINITY_DN19394_c1_g3_i1.p1 TRINITY_DN19394_c1_g3~~TRINITY_DN19394_c1_g3_i1.p1  ORF type:complete len:259 (+),score=25.37 TRINITY_DN19394_c1_g3_i1:57-779(+)
MEQWLRFRHHFAAVLFIVGCTLAASEDAAVSVDAPLQEGIYLHAADDETAKINYWQMLWQHSFGPIVLLHVGFGVVFYFAVVKRYRSYYFMGSGSDTAFDGALLSQEMMMQDPCSAALGACCTKNWWLAMCCTPARQAMTYHVTGILSFFPSLLFSTFCSCCMVWFTSSFTDMNDTLGGNQKNCCEGCVIGFCCSCCVVAQDSEALDLATGSKTGFCSLATNSDCIRGNDAGKQLLQSAV